MAAPSVERRVRLGPVAPSGFPVRSLTRQLDGTSGEWITAYQADQRRRLRAVLSTSVRGSIESGKALRPPTNTREASGTQRKTLDGSFLLKHCYGEKPSDLCVCNISGEALQEYKLEDFALFDNVVHINAADNQLPLEAFTTFPLLQELELMLNSIVDVSINQGDFRQLQSLDLSYNSLSGMALLALGTLPSLKELHLTGNNIVALPAEMSRPFPSSEPQTDSGEGTWFQIRFPALECLWLDDNKLTDQTTFATLAGLRRLRYLNLDNNEMYAVPQLKLIGTSPLKGSTIVHTSAQHTSPTHTTTKESGQDEPAAVPGQRSPPSNSQALRQTVVSDTTKLPAVNPVQDAVNTPDSTLPTSVPPNTAHQEPASRRLSEPRLQEPRTYGEPTLSMMTVDQLSGSLGRITPSNSMAPFPKLETLSLANNLILTAEGLLACGSWAALRELIIHGNPLTRTARGMPPLLQTHLVDQNGISVVRRKPSSRKRHTIGKSAKEFKKVSSAPPPTIPKQPLLPAIEAPPMASVPMLEYPSPSSSSPSHSFASESQCSGGVEEEEEEDEEGREEEEKESCKVVDDQEGVFMTQGAGEELQEDSPPRQGRGRGERGETSGSTNEGDKSWSVREDFRRRMKELKQKYRHAPDCYRGYEALFDTYEDPTMPIPTDLTSCSRALQYALKHPLVVPDTGALSHSPGYTRDYLKRKPPPTISPRQSGMTSKVRDLQHVLDDIRTRCIALEANLGEVLQPQTPPGKKRRSRNLQKESQQLLAEMQARYNEVRASSLRMLKSVSEFGNSSPSTTSSLTARQHSPRLSVVRAGREKTRSASPKLNSF